MAFREVAVVVLSGGLLLAACDVGGGKGAAATAGNGGGDAAASTAKATGPGQPGSGGDTQPAFDPSQFATPFEAGSGLPGMGQDMSGMGDTGGRIPNPFSDEPVEYREASEDEIRMLVSKLSEPVNPVAKTPGGMSAARDLMSIGPKAAPIIAEALDDEDPRMREMAIYVLANMFYKDAVPKIAEILDSDDDHDVRITAAKALGVIRDERAVEALLKHIYIKDTHARFFVLNSLGQQENSKAIPALAVVAVEDADAIMRRASIYGLGLIKDPAALEHLVKVLEDGDDDIRTQAVRAMGEIGGKETLPYLLKALEDTSASVRREAVYSLNTVGGDEALEAIANLLEREKKDFVIQIALWTVAQLGDKSHISIVKPFVDSTDSVIRERAIRTIHALDGQPTHKEIRQHLKSEDPHLRLYALWLYGIEGTSDNENIADLAEMIGDEDEAVRLAVVQVMGKFRSRQLVPIFRKVLEQEKNVVILQSALSDAQIYTTRDIFYDEGALGQRANEEKQMIYVSAEDDLVPIYISMLMHEDLRLRQLAATAVAGCSGLDFGYMADQTEEERLPAQQKVAAWWEEKSSLGPKGWMKRAVEDAFDKLEKSDPVLREIYSDALRSVTGQPYRVSVESSDEQVSDALSKWRAWWKDNSEKSRLEWLVEGIADEARPLEERFAIFVDIYWFYTGEHFGAGPSSPPQRKREAIGQFLEWWEENSERLLTEHAGR